VPLRWSSHCAKRSRPSNNLLLSPARAPGPRAANAASTIGDRTAEGRSSTGRAPVSKTGGCRFESCRPCQPCGERPSRAALQVLQVRAGSEFVSSVHGDAQTTVAATVVGDSKTGDTRTDDQHTQVGHRLGRVRPSAADRETSEACVQVVHGYVAATEQSCLLMSLPQHVLARLAVDVDR
jgi:hypothetical protein